MWGVFKQPLMQGIFHIQESEVGDANPSPNEVMICHLPESGYKPPEHDTMTTPGARSLSRRWPPGLLACHNETYIWTREQHIHPAVY